jgi:hypothetical protein
LTNGWPRPPSPAPTVSPSREATGCNRSNTSARPSSVSACSSCGKRTSPGHWFRADSLALEDCTGDASEQILRIFDNQTLLSECDDKSDLAELAWGLTHHHELVQRRKGTGGGGWSVEQSRLRQTSGFAFEVELDSHAAELLGFLTA